MAGGPSRGVDLGQLVGRCQRDLSSALGGLAASGWYQDRVRGQGTRPEADEANRSSEPAAWAGSCDFLKPPRVHMCVSVVCVCALCMCVHVGSVYGLHVCLCVCQGRSLRILTSLRVCIYKVPGRAPSFA